MLRSRSFFMNAPRHLSSLQGTLRDAQMALRSGRAATAELWLRELDKTQPGELTCRWLLSAALLYQDKIPESLSILEDLLVHAPDFANARVDLVRALRRSGLTARARTEVRRVLEEAPHYHLAWLAYGDVLVDLQQYADARGAFQRALHTDPHRSRIEEATAALMADDRNTSERLFREVLQSDPSHVQSLCGLAAVSIAVDVPRDAERLLRHALKQSEHIPVAWRGLGLALMGLGRLEEAEAAAQRVLRIEPDHPQSWITLAAVCVRLMRQEQALEAYERAARLKPEEVRLRLSIGHVNKTLGRRAESEAAYKAALQMNPKLGETYWSLADLKNYTFSDQELRSMESLVSQDGHSDANQAQVYFALGKALEQRKRFPQSFAAYARGNVLRRRTALFDCDSFERRCARIRATFNAQFFATRQGVGDPSAAPIFIVGLPRSGSTLIEQILASHSRVKGTMELQNVPNLVGEFDDQQADRDGYPETVCTTASQRLRALGARYLEETAPLRLGSDRFTDKLPNNFSHIGLIHVILPNATIIDARRHPMDACFSAFKQHFAEGQAFTYDLCDLGRYYRCYLALMDHWDTVLPGKVFRMQYEDLVRDPESNIRRLLAHCQLEFEPNCLSFHATRRSVRTASAEQVRQPIYTTGVGYWRAFEKELEPLAAALGDALERFKHI